MNRYIIGIDPDTKKSGVAIFEAEKKVLSLDNLNLVKLFGFLNDRRNEIELVVIESGESNRSLFNAQKAKGSFLSRLKIAMNIGKNFQLTDDIAAICEIIGIKYAFFVPKSAKITKHETMLTYLNGRCYVAFRQTNQETRDAIRCIFKYIL